MRQNSQTRQTGAAKAIKDIRRATRKQYSAEEKIRIVLDGLTRKKLRQPYLKSLSSTLICCPMCSNRSWPMPQS
jgi:hypothetical protein